MPQTSTLSVRVPAPDQFAAFDQQLAARHYLGAGRPVGDYLRQIVERAGQQTRLFLFRRSGCVGANDAGELARALRESGARG